MAQPAPMADLFGGGMPGGGDIFGTPSAPVASTIPSLYNAYEDSVIKIEFSFKRVNQNEHNIKAFFSNKQMTPVSQVTLQIAVQKYMRLTLQGISSSDIAANSS